MKILQPWTIHVCLNEKRWTVCLMLLVVLSWLSQPPSQHTRLITLKAGGCHGDDLIVTGGTASCWSASSGDTKVILAPFVFGVTYTYWYCLKHKYTAVPSWCGKRSPIFPWRISHGSLVRASYGVSFMGPVWLMVCLISCNNVCNAMLYWTALWRHSTVYIHD